MNKLMKGLSGGILMYVLFTACNKDEVPAATSPGCKVSSITMNSFQIKMSYSPAGYLTGTSLSESDIVRDYYTYTYPNGQVLERGYSKDSVQRSICTYTIGANGYASQSVNLVGANTDSTFYTYNADGYLISLRSVSYISSNGKLTLSSSQTTTYTITNGNKVKEAIVSTGTDDIFNFNSEVVYEYYADKTGYSGLFNDYDFLGKNSASLIKKTTTKNSSGQTSSTDYTYEFDATGKPVKVLQSTATPNGLSNTTLALQFQCL